MVNSRHATQDGAADPLGLLRLQAELYGRLESTARTQRALVVAGDHAPLLALLADRQKVSMELARVNERFEPLRRDWTAHKRRLTSDQQAEADALIGDIKSRLRRVIESDEQDARVLAARKEAVAGGLRAAHATSAALSAYGARVASGSGPERFDEAS